MTTQDRIQHLTVRGHAPEVLAELQVALVGQDYWDDITRSGNSLTFEQRSWPTWIIVCCILLFPIGLLTLLAGQTVKRSLLTLVDDGNGTTTVTAAGWFGQRTTDRINSVLDPRLVSA